MRKLIFSALAGLSLALMASQGLAKEKHLDVPASLQSLISHWHLKLIKSFSTAAPGIVGYVVKEPNGRSGILYSYKDFVLSGSLFNNKGENLSQKYAGEQIPKPDYDKAAVELKQMDHVITEGKSGAAQAYVFADPNCIFCHKFWEMSRKWVKDGKVQLHWVLVGFLKPSSQGKSAAIMTAKDPVKALTEDETGFDTKHEEGAIKPVKKIPKELGSTLKMHEQLMDKLQFNGTPALVYQSPDGKWKGIGGMPQPEVFEKELGINQ